MRIFNFVKNSIKEEMRYKTNFFGGILALLTLYSLQFVFFDVISSIAISKEDDSNWLLIFFMSYAIGGLLVSFFSSSISGFFRQLTRGRIDPLLVRPINLFKLIFFRWCQVHFLFVAVLLLLFCIASEKIDLQPFLTNTTNTALYLLVLIAGVLASVAFLLALNSFSFMTQRDLPVDYIHSSIFTFALLPTTFYSKLLMNFLVATLPMIVFVSAALDALYHGVTLFVITFITISIAQLTFATGLIKKHFKRFDSIGG